MKKHLLFFLLSVTVFLLLTGFSGSDDSKKAMWVENTDISENRESILTKAKENGVNVLYVKIEEETSSAAYSSLIREAAQSEIEVHALGGEPSWALAENQQQILDFIERVESYNSGMAEKEKFQGVHLKIQPQYLPEWYENENAVLKEWKENLNTVLDRFSEDTPLELSSSIPFWLDEKSTPGAPDTPFSTWIIRHFDHTAILAYRDTLEGPNGIVRLTKNELEAADKLNKQILIGVTVADTGQDHTTFFEEGVSDMNMHLNLVDKHLGTHDSYKGTAVDDFSGLVRQENQSTGTSEENKNYRGTYIWEAETLINEEDSIIEFAKEKNINLLYTRLDLSRPHSAYSNFVEKANAEGIEVHAMGGHPSWALKEEESRMLNLVNYVKEYNDSVEEGQKFAGIHLDIEPYTEPSWAENQQDILSQWMDNIELFVKETKRETNLEASMDLAMWFDTTKTPGQPDKSFSEWVISKMDHTSVMAFRDKAEGSGGILDMARNEIEYAESVNKEVIISVEIKENEANPQISFHDEGASFMEAQLDIVDNRLTSYSSYQGYVVHAYRYWKNQKNNS
ncbi:hypothetical protein [Salibacterium halotolerans]|uniref:Uncharacterized protein n=1 Tax=Salibacterium halotolerans TaxID=1884432 RepID=A0A1I5W5V5_9BACI|nr:hypothetical protein [Salibacterium halotolerans]SFQ15007.1 hypothetical protein SAMN05518683_1192 [Salibacterium halotolerans]